MRAAGLVVVGLLAVAAPARAREPADCGISMSGWAGAAVDRSVAVAGSGRPLHDGAPLIGVTALGNIRSVALGGCARHHSRHQGRRPAGDRRSCWGFSRRSTAPAFNFWAKRAVTASRTWAAT